MERLSSINKHIQPPKMPYKFDPEVEVALAPRMAAKAQMGPVAPHDVDTRRKLYGAVFGMLNEQTPNPGDVSQKIFHTKTPDGHNLEMTWFTKNGAKPSGSAVIHIHGGGMILASVPQYTFILNKLVSATSVPFLAVEYRYAPEHPAPTLVEDCYVALTWLRDNASSLGVDPNRIGIYGDSGGGGIAAGLALLARDHAFSPPIAKQILIYPMLDDRNTVPDPAMLPFIGWSYDDNLTGWAALVGKDIVGTEKVSEYAAAARAKDVSRLPPTYIDVGELDIFRDEDVEYARRMMASGVSVELHVHPGVPHAWEFFAPDADVSKRAIADRIRAIMSF